MPNNHTQVVDFYGETMKQVNEIRTSIGKEFDFNKIIPCHCYNCNPSKMALPDSCKEELHFSCDTCDKAFKDAGIKQDEWYDIHINIWGTKWKACEVVLPTISKAPPNDVGYNLHYEFWTAWAPPIPVYEALAQQLKLKYGKSVWFEVACHDEFTWIPDDKNNKNTGYHIDPDELQYWNSIDRCLITHPLKMWNSHETHRTNWESSAFHKRNEEIFTLGGDDEDE